MRYTQGRATGSVAPVTLLVGRTGTLRTADKLQVHVRVLDTRECWGRRDVLVTPVAGFGECWVALDRVALQ